MSKRAVYTSVLILLTNLLFGCATVAYVNAEKVVSKKREAGEVSKQNYFFDAKVDNNGIVYFMERDACKEIEVSIEEDVPDKQILNSPGVVAEMILLPVLLVDAAIAGELVREEAKIVGREYTGEVVPCGESPYRNSPVIFVYKNGGERTFITDQSGRIKLSSLVGERNLGEEVKVFTPSYRDRVSSFQISKEQLLRATASSVASKHESLVQSAVGDASVSTEERANELSVQTKSMSTQKGHISTPNTVRSVSNNRANITRHSAPNPVPSWIQVGDSLGGFMTVYLDKESIEKEAPYLINYKTKYAYDYSKHPTQSSGKYDYTVYTSQINCRESTLRVIENRSYKQGELVYESITTDKKPRTLRDGTVGAKIKKLLCNS